MERSQRLFGRSAEIEQAIAAQGLPFRIRTRRASADLTIEIGPLQRGWGNVDARYSLALRLPAVCEVFFAESTVQIGNLASGRSGEPFLSWWRFEAPIAPFELAAGAIEALGRRRASPEEAWEPCPGLGFVPGNVLFQGTVDAYSALTMDLNSWLEDPDAAPRSWQTVPRRLEPLAALVDRIYQAGPEALPALADARSPWLEAVESLVRSAGAGRVEVLAPGPFPASGWTLDFGDVTVGDFHARFCTDVFVSRLAPAWYFTNRFALVHPVADALIPELRDGSAGELGMIPLQTELGHRLREQAAASGCQELMEWQLTGWLAHPAGPAPDGRSRQVTIKDLLFRDVLGVFEPAPRMLEEQSHRALGTRICSIVEPAIE